jgi:PglZ domain
MTVSVLGRLAELLDAATQYDPNVQEAPVALLWPDESRQWGAAVEQLTALLPMVTLGDYDPATRRGPAYWVRCVVAGKIDAGLVAGTPIIYLPGVGKAALRASDDCSPQLAPIAELQFRSQWFMHPKGRDWSVPALLSNPARGLGLNLASDEATKAVLKIALPQLLQEPVDRLKLHALDADYLHELIEPEPVVGVLRWLDDPVGLQERLAPDLWRAFSQRCMREFEFDPATAGEVDVARLLAGREGPWAKVWKRFAETPNLFLGVVEQLRKARPDELIVDETVWPQDAESREDDLRSRLRRLSAMSPAAAREEIARLEAEHADRRSTVWAELDRTPLAFAMEQLRQLAELTETALSDETLARLISDYEGRGPLADEAVVRALESVPDQRDRAVVEIAIATVYRWWVDAGARGLQRLIAKGGYVASGPPEPAPGTVALFIDGLRLDLGRRLRDRLEAAGMNASITTALAALPTVTQTSKSALVPVAPGALGPGSGLQAADVSTGSEATVAVLRRLLEANGVQVLKRGEVGDPARPAFAEAGHIDGSGHDHGIQMVDEFERELGRIAGRVRELLDAGWKSVEVITDHGWLLIPGGMEKVELPTATASLKKGRCARLKEGGEVDVQTIPWHWDPNVRIAIAPGAACFEANKEYEHGGISPQECVVPRLVVRSGAAGVAELTAVKWLGLQCRVELSGIDKPVLLDLRTRPGDPDSSIADRSKETTSSGRITLLVPDEELEGQEAYVVLLADGRMLAQYEVVVGENR